MNEVIAAIERATALLLKVTPSSLEAGFLNSIQAGLEQINIASLLKDMQQPEPQNDDSEEETENDSLGGLNLADSLNRKIHPLNEALDKVKKLRETLNLEALDGIIKAGQQVVRPLYNYTAGL